MSIHKSKRTLSSMQYEDSFKRLYNDVRDRMLTVPKRRQELVARPIINAMNSLYATMISIESDPVKGTKSAADIRYTRINESINRMMLVEKPLWVWWNICGDKKEPDMHEKDTQTSLIRMRRKLKKFKGLVARGLMTLDDVFTSVQSWLGHTRCASAYRKRKEILRIYAQIFGAYRMENWRWMAA